MTGDYTALAPNVQTTIGGWHRFVETLRPDELRPLLADQVVFRSPFVHLPIPGKDATFLILTTVTTIFENFRYHRVFTSGTRDVTLEFSANIGDLGLKGVDLIKFDASGRMIEFEVMVRPIKALQALGTLMGDKIGPQLAKLKGAAAGSGSVQARH